MAQVVEHVLGKDEVTSSNLVNSSTTKGPLSFGKEGLFRRVRPFPTFFIKTA